MASDSTVVVIGGGVSDLTRLIRRVVRNQEQMMADFTQLNAKLDEHNTALTDAVARVQADVQELVDKIAELELDTADQEAVDAVTARVQASVEKLNAVDPVAPVGDGDVDGGDTDAAAGTGTAAAAPVANP